MEADAAVSADALFQKMAALMIDRLGKDSPDKTVSALENTLRGIRLDADETLQKEKIAEAMSLMDHLKLAPEAPDMDASAAGLSQLSIDDTEPSEVGKTDDERWVDRMNLGAPTTPTPSDSFHFTTPAAVPAPRERILRREVGEDSRKDETPSTATTAQEDENLENEQSAAEMPFYGFHLGKVKAKAKPPTRSAHSGVRSGVAVKKGPLAGTPKQRRRRKSKGSPKAAALSTLHPSQVPVNLSMPPPKLNGTHENVQFDQSGGFSFATSAFMPPPPPPPPPPPEFIQETVSTTSKPRSVPSAFLNEPAPVTTRLNARVRRESEAERRNTTAEDGLMTGIEEQTVDKADAPPPPPPTFDASRVSFGEDAKREEAPMHSEPTISVSAWMGDVPIGFSVGTVLPRKSPDKKPKRRSRKPRQTLSMGTRSSSGGFDFQKAAEMTNHDTSTATTSSVADDRETSPASMDVDSEGSFGRENQEPDENPNLDNDAGVGQSEGSTTPIKQDPADFRTPRRRLKAKPAKGAAAEHPNEPGVKPKQQKNLMNVEKCLEDIDAKARAAREAYNRGEYGAAAQAYEDAFRIGLDVRLYMTQSSGLHSGSDEIYVTESALGRFQGNRAAALMMHGQYRMAISASEKATKHDESLLRVHCRRARAHLKLGEIDLADSHFTEVYSHLKQLLSTSRDPSFAEGSSQRIQVERAAAEAATGVRDTAQLRRLHQQAQDAFERLELTGATTDVERGLALAPADHVLWRLKVGILIQQRRYSKAVEAAETGAKICFVARSETVLAEQATGGAEARLEWAHSKWPEDPALRRAFCAAAVEFMSLEMAKSYAVGLRLGSSGASSLGQEAEDVLKAMVAGKTGMGLCEELRVKLGFGMITSNAENESKQVRFKRWAELELNRLRDQRFSKAAGDEAFRNGNYARAVAAYTAALRADPDDDVNNSILFCNRAAARMGQERYREAFEDCYAALRRNADYWRARLRRARVAVKLRRFSHALSDFEKYAAQGPEFCREVEAEMRDCRRLAAWEQDRAQYDSATRRAGRQNNSSYNHDGYGSGARVRPGYASRHCYRSKPSSHAENGWSGRRFDERPQDGDPWRQGRRFESSRGGASHSRFDGRRDTGARIPHGPKAYSPKKRKEPTLYEALGVSKDATAVVIKKAFHKAALKYHPDKNRDDPETADKFRCINDAYQTLIDPKQRRDYDLKLASCSGSYREGNAARSSC